MVAFLDQGTEFLSKIRPHDNRLYIEVMPRADRIGSIAMPETFHQRTEMATVKAVGEKVNGFKVGDIILISWHTGVHIQLPQTYSKEPLHRIITQEEILARIEG